ncbi:TetR/AcrR family transcriptional regulator (plasmid) [Rhodococcus ruber]|uniref:TetR/AcrR family transcriptional regulator n=1 Tax=Rhodococcus ruber TaxID=1830 RepID=UPI002658A500|nr:TetR/AcrR family transcriptional regulator [Rhodococcus ruber]WKK14875.1 TetR/AcrR family transcriptional regulator [Rhodococcus ruber]
MTLADDSTAANDASEVERTKSARTRRRILDSAAYVLSRNGFAGTRLTDVAERAGIRAPAIYYYFESREDLIAEVLWTGTHMIRRSVTQVLDDLPLNASALDRIECAAREHLRLVLIESDYSTATVRNAGQIPRDVRLRQLREEERYAHQWSELINAAAESGELREDLDIFAVRMFLVGSLNWAAEWWSPRRVPLDVAVATAMSFIRNGISKSAT